MTTGATAPLRVLVLNAPIGGGHTATARALAARLGHAGAEVVVEVPMLATGLAGLPALYARLTAGRPPLVWSMYYYARRLGPVRRFNGWLIRRQLRPALDRLSLGGFDLVVLTHHMYGHCLSQLAEAGAPVVVLVTDLFGGPLEWFAPGAHRYVVPSMDMWHEARRRGVPERDLLLRRLPTLAGPAPSSARPAPGGPLRILVVGGADGVGPIRRVVAGLAGRDRQVTVVCGRNLRLRASLARRALPGVRTLGFVDDLPALVGEHDLVVTKPGSVTVQELLDRGVPFLLLPGIPGVERGNARRISRLLGLPMLRGARDARRLIDRLTLFELARAAGRVDAELPEAPLTVDDLSTMVTRPGAPKRR